MTFDPETGQFVAQDPIQRFFRYVPGRLSPDDCWEWMGGRYLVGLPYGRFTTADHRAVPAHRWLLGELRGQELGPEELGLHHCDNPPCVNPGHLYVGSAVQNAIDRESRGRGNNWIAKERSLRTHCAKGHRYDEQNTIWRKRGSAMCRDCRECGREAQRQYQARKRIVP